MAAAGLTKRVLLSGLAAAPFIRTARAQSDWPQRPVRVMVPYPPAGGADPTARIVYARLSESFGQQFAIENRGGAGGTIGEEVVAKSAPDGYTILHDATAFSINGSLYGNLAFDYRKDFDPVFLVALVPNILVVTPVGTGEHGCRCDRARQSDARRHRYGIIRQRHAAARVARTASAADRHHDQPRAVSRRRAGDNRCDGWT